MPRLVDVYPYRKHRNHYEYLVLERACNTIYEGQWRMIGGKVEEKEKAWEAALRELKEEVSQVPINFWSVPSINHFYDHTSDHIELIPVFAAELSSDCHIMLKREHSKYKWIESDEISRFIIWPEQERLLTLIHTLLTSQKTVDNWNISF